MDLSIMNNLPDEILSKIFQCFSLKERKNAKLVCKKWNQVLLRKEFTDTEVFFTDHVYDISILSQILQGATRPSFNLTIFDQEFETLPPKFKNFFQIWGHRIESLNCFECYFSSQALEKIFVHCTNLKEFSARQCPGPCNGKIATTRLPFGSNLVREKLRKFHIDSDHSHHFFQLKDFNGLAAAFPKIEILEIHNLEFIGKTKFLLRAALDRMKNLKIFHIELCNYRLCDIIDDPEKFQKQNLAWNSLEAIEMTLSDYIVRHGNLNKILSHKYWTSLFILEMNTFPNLDAAIIARLLVELPHLEKFKIIISDVLNVQSIKILFLAMVHSRLKSVHFEKNTDYYTPSFVNEEDLPQLQLVCESFMGCNNTVQYLSIWSFGDASLLLSSFFLKHFLNIRELYSEAIVYLDVLFKYQKHLEVATLLCATFDNVYLESDIIMETSELPCLKALSVIFQIDVVFWPLLLATYRFPKLERLELMSPTFGNENEDIFVEDIKSLVSCLSRNSSDLEILNLHWAPDNHSRNMVHSIEILKSFGQFRQLRRANIHLHLEKNININRKLLDETLLALIKRCPLLRRVGLGTGQMQFNFIYNWATNKWDSSIIHRRS